MSHGWLSLHFSTTNSASSVRSCHEQRTTKRFVQADWRSSHGLDTRAAVINGDSTPVFLFSLESLNVKSFFSMKHLKKSGMLFRKNFSLFQCKWSCLKNSLNLEKMTRWRRHEKHKRNMSLILFCLGFFCSMLTYMLRDMWFALTVRCIQEVIYRINKLKHSCPWMSL